MISAGRSLGLGCLIGGIAGEETSDWVVDVAGGVGRGEKGRPMF